ncbi:MAG TPA: hypothetical protein PKD72_03645 [Gemmatales bacterium]|nr:hypothetical protein [Gemmatales bacterium]
MRQLQDRIKVRSQMLEKLNQATEPKGLQFDAAGVARLTQWQPRKETEDTLIEKIVQEGEPGVWKITTGPSGRAIASLRAKVILPAGSYRWAALARAENPKPSEGHPGNGAGLRISGSPRSNEISGTTDWKLLVFEIEIREPSQEVELVAELRAHSGSVNFRENSFKLVRVKKE